MEGISQTVQKLILDHTDFVKQLSDAQSSFANTISNAFTITMVNSQLTLAQLETNNLSSSLSNANLLLVITSNDDARSAVTAQIADLQC
jgi:competence protein ComGC